MARCILGADRLLANLTSDTKLAAIITDNNFLAYDPNIEPKLEFEEIIKIKEKYKTKVSETSTLGQQLIKKIRNGEYGEQLRKVPIFFNSGDMNASMEAEVHGYDGYTQCYNKGPSYQETVSHIISGIKYYKEVTEPINYSDIKDKPVHSDITLVVEAAATKARKTALGDD